MSFGDFVQYVELYQSGGLVQDQAYKHYDLLYKASNRRLKNALKDCGFTDKEMSISLAECATRIRERGLVVTEGELQQGLLEWYVWRRINRGVYRRWTYRKK